MNDPITSKSLDGQSELVLRMPIREGLVEGIVTKTYASRVADIAELFSELRIASRESRLIQPFSDVVDRIQTIHAVHITVADGHVILTVAFDQPWEPYIRSVWRGLGKLLDVILVNCEGYLEHHASNLGFRGFEKWIRDTQINTDTFYLARDQSVTDVIYLEELERQVRGNDYFSRRFTHSIDPATPAEVAKRDRVFTSGEAYVEYIKLGVRAMSAFHSMTLSYGKGTVDHDYLLDAVRDVLRVSKVDGRPDELAEFPHSSDWMNPSAAILDLQVALTPQEQGQLQALQGFFATEITWFETAELVREDELNVPVDVPIAKDNIQGGIVERYPANTGCLVLAQVQDPVTAREFLENFAGKVTTATSQQNGKASKLPPIYRNIAFTFSGLERLGVAETELQRMPMEFRQGMAERAGLIGDVRTNHPDQWPMIDRNWPLNHPDADSKVNVGSIDVVIKLAIQSNEYIGELVDDHPLLDEINKIADGAAGGLLIVGVQAMANIPGGAGHFELKDGISQPSFEIGTDGQDDAGLPFDAPLPNGELFLGHKNTRGDQEAGEEFSELQMDGTFLVVRKLAQHVDALNKVVDAHIGEIGTRDFILGQMLGRNPDGSGYWCHFRRCRRMRWRQA